MNENGGVRALKKVAAENETLTVRGAELVVDSLIQQGVTHVFGIPGAKIDAVFFKYVTSFWYLIHNIPYCCCIRKR